MRKKEISRLMELFLYGAINMDDTLPSEALGIQDGILYNKPLGGTTTIIFDTVAQVEALTSAYSLVYCKETDTFYEYDATDGSTRDGLYTLNTADGGTTRYIGKSGKYIKILINLHEGIQFGLNPTDTIPAEGKIFWNDTDGTLNVGLKGGNVMGQMFQELHLPKRGKNVAGVQVNNGQAVVISGASGAVLEVNLINNLDENSINTIAIATEDVPNNQQGYFTTFGAVRDFNTLHLTEGQPVYLDTTNGNLTSTMPTHPSLCIQIGICTRSHATEGEIFVSIRSRENERDRQVLKEPTGFYAPELVVINGDSATRKVTLTGTTEAYYQGRRLVDLISGWISPAHGTDTSKEYFLIYDGSTYRWLDLSLETLDFAYVQIAYASYDSTNATWFYERECHGLMPWQSHRADHKTVGTYRDSGGTLANYVVNSTTVANRRPSIASTLLYDEDLPSILASLASGGNYTQYYISSTNGAKNFVTTATDIVPLNGNQPYYNQFNGTNWVQTLISTGHYMPIWVRAIPQANDATSQKYRFLFCQGQTTSLNIEDIRALKTQDHNLGLLKTTIPEGVYIAKIIIRYVGGNWTIQEVEDLTGTRESQVSSPSGLYLSSVTTDSTLTGIGTASSPLGINLNNANGWNALQTFNAGFVDIDFIINKNTSGIAVQYDAGNDKFISNALITEINGDLHVNGDIVQSGASYETHVEQVYTKDNLIITRDGAISGLGVGEYTGFQAKLYDGVNDGQLVFDKDGWARVGDVGNLQKLATIEETPLNGGILFYNTATFRLETDAGIAYDPATNTLKIDTINEITLNAGVTIDGVLIKDGTVDGRDISADWTTISNHIANTSNPHSVTKSQVGLSAVTNDAQLKRADGDFNSFTEKTTLVDDDIFLIEDSGASYAKKKVKRNNIWSGRFLNLLENSNFINVSSNGYGYTTGAKCADMWSDYQGNSIQGGFPEFTKQQLIDLTGATDGQIEGLWNLNEASGNATDLSSNAYTLTASNMASTNGVSLMNYVRSFNGSNGYLGGITASNANITTAQTWFGFVRTSAIGSNQCIASFGASGNQRHIRIDVTGKIVVQHTGTTVNSNNSDVILEANKWYFVAWVYDGANVSDIYVNGIKATANVGTIPAISSNFAIGRREQFNDMYFNGQIQNFGIISTNLTESQIKKIWAFTNYKGIKIQRLSGLDATIYQSFDVDFQNVTGNSQRKEALIQRLAGKTVTYVAKIYQEVANTVKLNINITGSNNFSTPVATIGSWTTISKTLTLPAVLRDINPQIGVYDSNGNAWIKEVAFYEGSTLIDKWEASPEDWNKFPRLMRMDPPPAINGYSYEEGRLFTYTPNTIGITSPVYNARSGKYIFNGKHCKVDASLSIASYSSPTGQLRITLPIIPQNSGSCNSFGTSSYTRTGSSENGVHIAYINTGDKAIILGNLALTSELNWEASASQTIYAGIDYETQ